MNYINNKLAKKQHGAVLVMALLMLFVLTLIGVSSINTTTLEEKMSGNTRNRQLALQAAESAIREAERFIINSVNNPVAQFPAGANGTNGLYALGDGPNTSEAVSKSWWLAPSTKTSVQYSGQLENEIPAANYPLYTIEYTGETVQPEPTSGGINPPGEPPAGSIHTFRITARATGLTTNSVVVLQTQFGKRI